MGISRRGAEIREGWMRGVGAAYMVCEVSACADKTAGRFSAFCEIGRAMPASAHVAVCEVSGVRGAGRGDVAISCLPLTREVASVSEPEGENEF